MLYSVNKCGSEKCSDIVLSFVYHPSICTFFVCVCVSPPTTRDVVIIDDGQAEIFFTEL